MVLRRSHMGLDVLYPDSQKVLLALKEGLCRKS